MLYSNAVNADESPASTAGATVAASHAEGSKSGEPEGSKPSVVEGTKVDNSGSNNSNASKPADESESEAVETNRGKSKESAFKTGEVAVNNACTYGAPSQPKEETPARKRALQVGPLDILCGKTAKCGTASITVDDSSVTVTVTKSDGWNINHVHIFAGPGWPTAWATKAPPPGQFPFQQAIDASTFTSLTHKFPLNDGVLTNICGAPLATGGQLAIAIHTESAPTNGGSSETGWAKGNVEFGSSRWGWYQSLCVPCGDGSDVNNSDFSMAALESAAKVQDPVEGAVEKKVKDYKDKKEKKEKKEKEEKEMSEDDGSDASEKSDGEDEVKAFKAKLNDKTVKTNNGADIAVRVIQAAFDRHADKFAKKGITATVSKDADGHIVVKLVSTTGAPISDVDEAEAVNVVASFAVVEEVLPADAVVDATAATAGAANGAMAVMAIVAAAVAWL
jgi:hypothetical protein